MNQPVKTTTGQKICLLLFSFSVCLILLEGMLRILSFSVRLPDIKSGTIVCIGDSFTYGIGAPQGKSYPDILNSLLPDKTVVNLGKPGANSAEIADIFQSYLLKNPIPEQIIFMGGVNDLWNTAKSAYDSRQPSVAYIFRLKTTKLFILLYQALFHAQKSSEILPLPALAVSPSEDILKTTAESIESFVYSVPASQRAQFEKYMYLLDQGYLKKCTMMIYDMCSYAPENPAFKYHLFKTSMVDLNYFQQSKKIVETMFSENPSSVIPWLCQDILRQHGLELLPNAGNHPAAIRHKEAMLCIQSFRKSGKSAYPLLETFINNYPSDYRASVFSEIIANSAEYEQYSHILSPDIKNYLEFSSRAHLMLSRGKIPEALQFIEIALILHPYDINSYALAAEIFREYINSQKASRVLSVAEKLSASSPNVLIQRAMIFQEQGLTSDAERIIKNCLAKFPDDTRARIYHSLFLSSQNKSDEAYEMAEKLYNMRNSLPEDLYETVCINYYKTALSAEKISSDFVLNELSEHPFSIAVRCDLAETMLNLSMTDAVKQILIESEDSSDTEIEILAKIYESEGNYVQQEEFLNRWIKKRPDSQKLIGCCINFFLESSRFSEADFYIEQLNSSIRDYYWAKRYFLSGNFDRCAEYISMFSEEIQDLPEAEILKYRLSSALHDPSSLDKLDILFKKYSQTWQFTDFLYNLAFTDPEASTKKCILENIHSISGEKPDIFRVIEAILVIRSAPEQALQLLKNVRGKRAAKLKAFVFASQKDYESAVDTVVKDYKQHHNIKIAMDALNASLTDDSVRPKIISLFLKKAQLAPDFFENRSDSNQIQYQNTLHRLKILCKNSAKITVITYPHDIAVNKKLQAACSAENIRCISLFSEFQKKIPKNEISGYFVYDGHCSEKGYAFIAAIIKNELFSR